MIMGSCNKDTKPTCSISGTNVNIGSTTGGFFYQVVSPTLTCNYSWGGSTNYYDEVGFDNTSFNFTVGGTSSSPGDCAPTNGTIMDVGAQTCLDFSYSGTPTANAVSYIDGHGYVGKLADGHTVKFIAATYGSGSVNITYIFQ